MKNNKKGFLETISAKSNHTKVEIKLVIYTILFIICLITTVVFTFKPPVKKVVDSMTYNSQGELTYSVCLKENEFISQSCFSENRSFVTSLIDVVNLKLNYNLNSSNMADYKYKYSVKALVSANEKGDTSKIVYSEEETLLEEMLEENDINNITLAKDIAVDYQKYNNLITNFKKDYVLALDSKVTITATISVIGKRSSIDEEIVENKSSSITIPLGEQTATVSDNNADIRGSGTIIKYSDERVYGARSFILDASYKFDILFAILIIISIIKYLPTQKEYTKVVSKIIKNYDQAIVKVSKEPSITGLKVIEVSSFNEILDARDNLEKPILFYQNLQKSFCKFVIIAGTEAYILKMDAFNFTYKSK